MDRPINFDRIPPQSLDMEQAALGAMLIERAAIEKAAEILEWKDFYSPAHQVVFDAILALTTTDRPVDLYTVQEQLKLQGVLEKIGGASYLVQLMNAPPSAANVEYYAKIVEEKAILRRLLEASSSVQAQCYSEYEDINEVVDSAEKAIFGVTQRRMKSYFSDMKTLANEVYTQVEHRSDNRDMTIGLETPFSEFNYMTSGLQPSDLIIVAARPSMGKTSLVLNIGQHAAMNQKTVAVFSLEMSKEQLCMRMICSEARVGQTALRTGFVPTGDWPKVGNAVAKLSACPIYIDDSPDCSALEMRAKCRRLMAERGLDLIIVDYLQLMRGHKRTENRNQEIAEIARSLKSLARELKVPVVALSQLSRAVEQRPNKRPMLSDLRESGSIEAEADMVAFIYRDAYYKKREGAGSGEDDDGDGDSHDSESGEEAEIIIAKHRNGPTGTVKLAWIGKYTRFDNLAHEGRYRDSD